MKLKRTYIWFHHIYNAKKKQNIAALGSKLDITGFCYTGKPGVIVIEGSQSDNKQFISTLRRWPWQKMTVRAIEDEEEADQGRRFDKFHMTGGES